jgi:ABC-type branched-subunit amino acid transport system ATPase component
LSESTTAAEVQGINVNKMKLSVFILSSVISAVAGGMFAAQQGFISPGIFGLDLSLFLLMACIIGGLNSPYGGLVAVVVTFLFRQFTGLERYRLLMGPLALFIVFFAPQGLAGLFGRNGLRSLRPTDDRPKEFLPIAVNFRAESISKSFGGLRALDDTSIEFRSGMIHALIGPNGSGKTTLIDCMTGVLEPDSGRSFLDNQPLDRLKPHRVAKMGIARTFQQPVASSKMTSGESAAVAAVEPRLIDSLFQMRRTIKQNATASARACWAMGLAGCESTFERPASDLSFGETKRLQLARALASRPNLLILDEPSAGLNETEVEALANLLRTLKQVGLGILLVDHHMNFVLDVADEVTVLDYGRVIAHGAPEEVRNDPSTMTAYLGVT